MGADHWGNFYLISRNRAEEAFGEEQVLEDCRVPSLALGISEKSLFQHPLLRHGDIVSAGVFHHIHHLVGLADDFMGALGVFRICRQPHAATDVQV
jgi:hypothetical protein